MTSIGGLLQERLKISITAIDRDSAVSETLKSGLKIIYQCLQEQRMSTQILESQLIEKASSSQMNYTLSQKLSVGQFLNYFQKIEKVMGGLENQNDNLSKKMQSYMMEKFEDLESMIQISKKEVNEKKKSRQSELLKIKQEIKQLVKIVENVSLLQQSNKQNMKQFNQKGRNKTNEDKKMYAEFLDELKVIQEYCEDNRKNIEDLSQSFAQKTRKQLSSDHNHNYVNFDDLRSVMGNLQASLNESLQKYRFNSQIEGKFVGNWDIESYRHLAITPYRFSENSFEVNGNKSLYILETGVYHIICGFFPKDRAELSIQMNGKVLARHLCQEPPENNLARTIMLYVRVDGESQLDIECSSKTLTVGFLNVQKLSSLLI